MIGKDKKKKEKTEIGKKKNFDLNKKLVRNICY